MNALVHRQGRGMDGMPGGRRTLRSSLAALAVASLLAPGSVAAQAASPLGVVRNLNLESERVGRVTAHFAPPDRERARQLAALLNDAAAKFDRDLGLSFPLEVAVLRPQEWFADIPGIPYAIPWPSMKERLILTPASLEEGILVERRSREEGERLVNFVTLHEYGHVAAREYFRPGDQEDYIPVQWFRELVATYFAYAYVMSVDPAWAGSAREEWKASVDAFEPEVLSLDWSFMGAMDGRELARTYEWYQFLLNLRAAELYSVHGVGLIRALKDLTWGQSHGWTPEALLDQLDDVVPELSQWARALGAGMVTYGPDLVTERGKYLNVWTQVNGDWKIKANMWNTDAPAPQ